MITLDLLLLFQLLLRREADQLSPRNPRSQNLLKFPNHLKLRKLQKLPRSPKQPRTRMHPKANLDPNPRRGVGNLQMASRRKMMRTPRR